MMQNQCFQISLYFSTLDFNSTTSTLLPLRSILLVTSHHPKSICIPNNYIFNKLFILNLNYTHQIKIFNNFNVFILLAQI